MRAVLLFGVIQDHPQSLEVGVDVGDDRVFHFKTISSHYFKPAKFPDGFAPTRFFVADETSHFGVLDRPPERFQFFLRALGQQFYPSIKQIANRPGYFKSGRQRPDRIPESDALHPSRIENVQPRSFHGFPIRGKPTSGAGLRGKTRPLLAESSHNRYGKRNDFVLAT